MLAKLKPKSEFSRNVLTLMTGTTIAQAIPIAISPILTRIYTPEDFGIFALYLSIASLVSVIATARYEMAIVLPHSDIDAINIVGLSIAIILLMTCLSMLIVIIFRNEILGLFKANVLGDLLYLIPVSLLLTGLYQVFNYWASRKKRFDVISQSRILQSSVAGVSQIGSGYFNYIGGLIIGNILGLFISIIRLIKNFDMELLKNINKEVMIFNMKKYKDFPLVNSIHVFSDVAKTSLANMMIVLFYGPIILGFYSLSMRILQAPLGVIGSSFSQVLYQRFSNVKSNNESIYNIAKVVIFKLTLFGLPVFIILFFTLPLIFAFIFGEEWRIAGEYSQILLPYLFLNFLVSPISQIPFILNRQREYFYISLLGNLLFLIILIYFQDLKIIEVLKILSSAMSFYYVFVIWWYYHILKTEDI